MTDFPTFPTDRAVLEEQVEVDYFCASGPGGQHRNRARTAVRLVHRPSGITVTASERRSQSQNRELAWERLIAAIRRRNHRPKKRRATRPTRSSVRKRLEGKKRRGEVKRGRRPAQDE